MLRAVLAAVAAAAGVRLSYARLLERRAERRLPHGPDGIIEGAATISLPRPGAPAVLLLHGGGDTPQALAGLAAHLHAEGYSVRAPLMESHGRSLRALANASAERWFEDAATEFDRLAAEHPRVSVVGLSMGGALAVRLGAERGRKVAALVLLAPYLDMPGYVRRLAESGRYWGWLLPYLPSGGRRSIHDPVAATKGLGHGIVTPASLQAFRDTMMAAVRALPAVSAPTLLIQSREDNRIAASSAERAFAQLGAAEKELVWTSGAGHVITVDYGHERVSALVAGWLARYSPPSPAAPAPRSSHRGP